MQSNNKKTTILKSLNTASLVFIVLGILTLIIGIVLEILFNIAFVKNKTNILIAIGVLFSIIYNIIKKDKKGFIIGLIAFYNYFALNI
ncbi:hypothetical protein [Staphylococcus chromogenes]|uniref:hypothetical protein n=1 Tax=Staphylococcus chromogenes TaxID=46126 RepID=UPI0039DFABFA